MRLKISTPSETIFEGEVSKVEMPTENGTIDITTGHVPMVTSVVPWIITIWSEPAYMYPDQQSYISTAKGMAFVDGKTVRIISADATSTPDKTPETLTQMRQELENKIAILQNDGSIEEIEHTIGKLGKINADIQLQNIHSKQ